jgi:tripartite-type tricarboxylate transporter receptor subunit TctC
MAAKALIVPVHDHIPKRDALIQPFYYLFMLRAASIDSNQGQTMMKIKFQRRQFLHLAAGAFALPAASRVARAQAYPTGPVRLVVGFSAGGGVDVIARLLGQWLSERMGQQFIVENRTGGNGLIARETVARAVDGYTLLLASSADAIDAALSDKLNFGFIRDIAPVAGIVRMSYLMLANPSFPAKSIPDFIAYAKANPGKINMGSAGTGGTNHVFGELFKTMANVDMVHVPYRGAPPAMTDLIGGQIQVLWASLPAALEYVRAGTLRGLAVTSAARSEVLPDVPAVGEFVPGYEASAWFGLGAPKNTPKEVIQKLNSEINAILTDQKIKTKLADLGCSPLALSPAEFGKLLSEDIVKWGKVIRAANIKPE